MKYAHATAASRQRLALVSLVVSLALLLPNLMLPAGTAAGRAAGSRGASAPPVPSKPANRQGGTAQGGDLLIRFRDGVSGGDAAALLASVGLAPGRRLRGASGVERVGVGEGQDASSLASVLSQSPLVEYAEPDYQIAADQVTPNDPRFPEQWALLNAGQRGGPAGADAGATAAWRQTTGSRNTVVAIIDSGVDITHPDLRTNVWSNPKEKADGQDNDDDGYADDLRGWDFLADSGEIKDEGGHGTAVAGLIAARGNNATGTAGVMWRASVMSLRVLDAAGRGRVSDAVEAIDYASSHGASITEDARQDVLRRGGPGSRAIQGFTIRDKDGQQHTVDGRPRIFLNLSAFRGGQLSLREVIAHEFIHAAGQPPVSSIPGMDDLTTWEHYSSIMDACR